MPATVLRGFVLVVLISCSAPSSPRIDLSQVQGIEHAELTDEARDLLGKNGFVALGGSGGNMAALYDSLYPLPKFITVDSIIEIFLIDLEHGFGKIEARQTDRLRRFHALLWDAAVALDVPPRCRTALDRVLGLVAVGRLLLDPEWKLPDLHPARRAVETDLSFVLQGAGRAESALWRRTLDGSVFKPVGPYASTEELRRSYRLARWWGFAGLQEDDAEERLCAGLLARIVGTTPGLADLLKEVDATYDQFLGAGDDVPLLALTTTKPLDSDAFEEQLLSAFAQAPGPILDKEGDRAVRPGEKPKSMRLLSPRRTPETMAMARLQAAVEGRWMPHGLDALAAFGDPRAQAVLVAQEAGLKGALTRLPSYAELLHQTFGNPPADTHFQKRLWDLGLSLSRLPGDDRLPRFMKTDAYRDRGLSAALATWAGAREIYSPHAQDIFERKGLPKYVPPLIEPNLEAWDRLIDLCLATQRAFQQGGASSEIAALPVARKLRSMAVRQLRGEILTEEDEHFGDWTFDGFLRSALANAVVAEGRPMTVHDGRVCVPFAKAVDPFNPARDTVRYAGKSCCLVYVVVDAGGAPQLYQGGVLDYREFDRAPGTVLTRKDFRALMNSKDAPPAPNWTATYRAGAGR
jgi:uncharacterized protein DUF3160